MRGQPFHRKNPRMVGGGNSRQFYDKLKKATRAQNKIYAEKFGIRAVRGYDRSPEVGSYERPGKVEGHFRRIPKKDAEAIQEAKFERLRQKAMAHEDGEGKYRARKSAERFVRGHGEEDGEGKYRARKSAERFVKGRGVEQELLREYPNADPYAAERIQNKLAASSLRGRVKTVQIVGGAPREKMIRPPFSSDSNNLRPYKAVIQDQWR
jgi:hypothetical protein